MNIDFNAEELLTLAEAARKLPSRPNVCTVWRWCRVGIGGIRLKYLKIGKRIFVSLAALNQFFAALAEADDSRSATEIHEKKSISAAREKAIKHAYDTLKEAGI